jgi:aryl-alcohol dehydrogenase-like predicted oxidoreductase
LREIQQIAKELGSNLTQVALAWVLRNQDVSTAIIGASQVSQIDDCLGSLQLLEKWTPELEQRINTVLDTTPTPKFNWGKFQAGTSRRAEQPKTQ